MDFSTPEPKPETTRNIDQTMIDKNKEDIFKFFNITTKTKIASTVAGLGLVLFFVAIYSVSFNNNTLNTLYPKDESSASNGQISQHMPITKSGFLLEGAQKSKVGSQYELNMKVKTGTDSATIIASQLHFDQTKLEVVGIEDAGSITKNWIDNNYNNTDGTVSLVTSFPKGIQLNTPDQFAKIIFKVKTAGQTVLSIDKKNSHLYRLSDKKDIEIDYDELPLMIEP